MAAPPVMLAGDCRTVLPTLPADSVHCCVTSPPYWGLRDYGTGRWEGGDPSCAHFGGGRAQVPQTKHPNAAPVIIAGPNRGGSNVCVRCGAHRVDGQIGLEASVAEYVAELVGVFREVRRVLRPDGTLWLNLGDAYAGGKTGRDDCGPDDLVRRAALYGTGSIKEAVHAGKAKQRKPTDGLKPKDLIGLPWRVAFALQADGWWLRSDIIWAKPNPMPESVQDRPTRAHEYVFMLSKSATYHFDADAVREPLKPGADHDRGREAYNGTGRTNRWGGDTRSGTMQSNPAGRNVRSVWTIATQSCSEAHFAVMPAALAERCIKAGCPQGGLVLDPFAGAGTTLLAADRLQRRGLGIELNPAYAGMAVRRVTDDAPLLAWTGDA